MAEHESNWFSDGMATTFILGGATAGGLAAKKTLSYGFDKVIGTPGGNAAAAEARANARLAHERAKDVREEAAKLHRERKERQKTEKAAARQARENARKPVVNAETSPQPKPSSPERAAAPHAAEPAAPPKAAASAAAAEPMATPKTPSGVKAASTTMEFQKNSFGGFDLKPSAQSASVAGVSSTPEPFSVKVGPAQAQSTLSKVSRATSLVRGDGKMALVAGAGLTAVAIKQGDYTAASQEGAITAAGAAISSPTVMSKIGKFAVRLGIPALRAGASEIPVIGAISAAPFALYETGSAAWGAIRGANSWKKVGTTALANGAEIGGGILGFGLGQAGRQAVVEGSKRLVGTENAPADAAIVGLGKEVYSMLTDPAAPAGKAGPAPVSVTKSTVPLAPAFTMLGPNSAPANPPAPMTFKAESPALPTAPLTQTPKEMPHLPAAQAPSRTAPEPHKTDKNHKPALHRGALKAGASHHPAPAHSEPKSARHVAHAQLRSDPVLTRTAVNGQSAAAPAGDSRPQKLAGIFGGMTKQEENRFFSRGMGGSGSMI